MDATFAAEQAVVAALASGDTRGAMREHALADENLAALNGDITAMTTRGRSLQTTILQSRLHHVSYLKRWQDALDWLAAAALVLGGAGAWFQARTLYHAIRTREESEHLLSLRLSAIEAAQDMIVITNAAGLIEYVNPSFTRCTGYEAGEVQGKKTSVLRSGRHDAAFYAELWRTITAGNVWQGQMVNRRKDGSLYPEEMTITPVPGLDGTIARFIAIKRDVTQQRENENRYRMLFESSHDAIMTLEPPSWKFTSCNAAAAAMFGVRNPEEFASLGPWEVSPELQPDGRASAEKAQEMIGTALREGSHFFEWMHQQVRGAPFPATVLLTRMEHAGGVMVQATVRNITARKQAEETLRKAHAELETRVAERTADLQQSLALLDTLQNHAPIGFGYVDCEYRFVRINAELAAMAGLPAADILGRTVADAVPNLWPQIEPLFRRALDGEQTVNLETSGRTAARPQETRHWLASYYPIRIAGKIAGVGIMVLDITERRRARQAQWEQEQSAHQQAIRAMERVLGIVAHELRNPLAGLRATSELLLDKEIRETKEFDVFVGSINAEVIRMSQTVDDLLEAARLNSGKARWTWQRVNLAEVCDAALATIRPQLDPERVDLRLHISPPNAGMHGDANAIQRLIVNLLSNAHKHTNNGHIAVTVREHHDASARWVEIHVQDTGTGIPAALAQGLGNAFALNSGIVGSQHVKGTGLGLALCKAVAAAHGGSLQIQSAPGRGTLVIARLRADLPEPAHDKARVEFIVQPTPAVTG